MRERCMCGADDCPKCFPSHFNRCELHGLYDEELEDCPKCEKEIEDGTMDRYQE